MSWQVSAHHIYSQANFIAVIFFWQKKLATIHVIHYPTYTNKDVNKYSSIQYWNSVPFWSSWFSVRTHQWILITMPSLYINTCVLFMITKCNCCWYMSSRFDYQDMVKKPLNIYRTTVAWVALSWLWKHSKILSNCQYTKDFLILQIKNDIMPDTIEDFWIHASSRNFQTSQCLCFCFMCHSKKWSFMLIDHSSTVVTLS